MMSFRMLPRVCGCYNMTRRATALLPPTSFFIKEVRKTSGTTSNNGSGENMTRHATALLPSFIKEVRMMTTNNNGSGEKDNKPKSKLRIKPENSMCPSAGEPQLTPAGLLFHYDSIIAPDILDDVIGENEFDNLIPKDSDNMTELVSPPESDFFIPQVKLHDGDGMKRKRVLVLCTGGTLTMAPNPEKGGSLSPVQGALTEFMKKSMLELHNEKMPDVVVHEYTPLLDSSDMGPPDWALLAKDIKANYLHFDGFVILMGTDTMAYTATALSFMLENLGKPVIFTGSQIPLAEPHTDARQNLIMALIFAARHSPICEVTIFFHDKLIRACRSTKGKCHIHLLLLHYHLTLYDALFSYNNRFFCLVNTGELHAFDSPNLLPLATTGISIKENEHLILPPARGVLRVHTRMDTRLLTIRLVPGFDDKILSHLIRAGAESGTLRALVLQLYGTGNAPSVKQEFIECLKDATELGILVVAATQCHIGSVMMGHYATGRALERAGVVSSNDMTLEATACKIAYLMGRGDLSRDEIADLMTISMRGEGELYFLLCEYIYYACRVHKLISIECLIQSRTPKHFLLRPFLVHTNEADERVNTFTRPVCP